MKYVLFLLMSLPLFAQTDLDQRLLGYIEKFHLAPLTSPTPSREGLWQLGQALFTTKSLSGNDNISCVECHHPKVMTIDALPLGLGEGANGIQVHGHRRVQSNGKILARNTPALFNLSDVNVLFWDGRVSYDPLTMQFITPVALNANIASTLKSALAAQAIFPIVNHDEMRGQPGSNPIADAKTETEAWNLIVQKLLAIPKFQEAFAKVYPGEIINIGHVGEAIAEFQRLAFDYSDTPYDQYLKGDLTALSEIQKLGMDIFFNKGKCSECHQGAQLSNFEFHNVGTPQIGPGHSNGDDLGRYEWDPKPENLYAFRVPPLRNVAMTAPYMHDGSFKTLPQVVEHYDMVVESLQGYRLVNNWKNYLENLTDHDHLKDEIRISSFSKKLTPRLEFQEEEEYALSEFLATALTDKAFLNREVEGDYRTYYRLQLKESGYQKISDVFKGETRQEIYYYFDMFREGGFALRGLAAPIRLILIKKPHETQLVFREQVYKTAHSYQGVVMEGNFNRQEVKEIDSEIFSALEEAYQDMFTRLYTYYDGTRKGPIPMAELTIMKNDLNIINAQFHALHFEGETTISDQMNILKEELYYVPTSFNTKDVTLFTLNIAGKEVEGNLQRSLIRTDTGSTQLTYALELEAEKVTKAEYKEFSAKIQEALKDLKAEDVGGGSPSPSNLTLEVLKQVL